MGRVLYPPRIVPNEDPIIFLAGPIQDAPPWQAAAIKIIHGLNDTITIACPRRPGVFVLESELKKEAQADWETFFLNKAGTAGVVMFWLAKETAHDCTRTYAQTSRFELGEWQVYHKLKGAKLVIGIEPGFAGARYIKQRIGQDCSDVIICRSLAETCQEAVRIFQQ